MPTIASVTFAPAAVLLTGNPPSRRGARNATLRSGPPIDCPAFATSSAAEPAPTPISRPRRLTVGGSGSAATVSPSGSGSVSASPARSGASTPRER